MNTTLWITQGLLASVFMMSGVAKTTQSRQRFIETKQTGVVDLPMPFVRFIGLSEILASLGMILPVALGIVPVLTPIAGIGLALLMTGAAVIHARLHEPKNVLVNAVLFAMCAFVSYGRLAG